MKILRLVISLFLALTAVVLLISSLGGEPEFAISIAAVLLLLSAGIFPEFDHTWRWKR